MQASQHQGADHAAPSRQSHGVTELGARPAGVAEQATGNSHAADAHGADAHGGEHHQEFNWLHGMVGVKEGVEPSLLWRTPDMPIPFASVLLNTALLFGLIFKFARKPVAKALADRRQRIMRGIEDATAMKEEAKRQLEFYRAKLDNLDAEIERVRREMRESAETERKRILEEAGTRRTRLEQEARLLMDQELKALREELTRETAKAALRSALDLLRTNTSTDDHRRLCEQYLETFQPPSPRQGDVGGRS